MDIVHEIDNKATCETYSTHYISVYQFWLDDYSNIMGGDSFSHPDTYEIHPDDGEFSLDDVIPMPLQELAELNVNFSGKKSYV